MLTVKQIESFISNLIDESQIEIDLVVTSSENNGLPKFSIKCNNEVFLDEELTEGRHEFNFKYKIQLGV